jgi:hypothetical protein
MVLTVSPLESTSATWQELTLSGLGSTPYHCPGFVEVVAASFGRRTEAWGAWEGGALVGGLLVVLDEHGRPDILPSVAFNGPVIRPPVASRRSAQDRHTSRVISMLLNEVGRERGAVIRTTPDVGDIRDVMANGWALRPTFTYEMHLPSVEVAWDSMDPNRRRLVNRAETLGYGVRRLDEGECRSKETVTTLLDLHRRHQSTYGPVAPVASQTWHRILGTLVGRGLVSVDVAVGPNGDLVAFNAAVVWGGRAGFVLTGSDPAHARHGANSLLRWRTAESFVGEGVARLDLNGSRAGEAGRFKASLGAVLTERWDLVRPEPRTIGRDVRRVASGLVRRLRGR